MAESSGCDAILEIADGLYALALTDFTPSRDARAKELRGDVDLARRVKALRKPSTAAWVVNLLVRFEAGQVDQVLGLGAALRAAQEGMSGEELRTLTRQRRQLTAAVTRRARAMAAEHGQRVTQAVADQVEATLTAAMVDRECAGAVRSGLLVTALTSTGVGVVELGEALAVPEAIGFSATARTPDEVPRPELYVVPDPGADVKAIAAARERVEEAEAELAEATGALAAVEAAVEVLEARAMQVQAEIDEVRGRLTALEETFAEVDDELGDAEDARSEAEEVVSGATGARDSANAALARLTSAG